MNFLFYLLIFVFIFITTIFIWGLPRKQMERAPNMEGLDDPEVIKGFNKMTKLPPFQLLYKKITPEFSK